MKEVRHYNSKAEIFDEAILKGGLSERQFVTAADMQRVFGISRMVLHIYTKAGVLQPLQASDRYNAKCFYPIAQIRDLFICRELRRPKKKGFPVSK